ncbi:MAG: hypothetical protein ACC653_00130 [Gammaproteobacteria bacterium]
MKKIITFLMLMSLISISVPIYAKGYVEIPRNYQYTVTIFHDEPYWDMSLSNSAYDYDLKVDSDKITVWAMQTSYGNKIEFNCVLTPETVFAYPGWQYYHDLADMFTSGMSITINKSSTIGPADKIGTCGALILYNTTPTFQQIQPQIYPDWFVPK